MGQAEAFASILPPRNSSLFGPSEFRRHFDILSINNLYELPLDALDESLRNLRGIAVYYAVREVTLGALFRVLPLALVGLSNFLRLASSLALTRSRIVHPFVRAVLACATAYRHDLLLSVCVLGSVINAARELSARGFLQRYAVGPF